MAACQYCRKRKGKRACPALQAPLCAACCGTHRLQEIACPSDCAYLPRAGQATRDAYLSAVAKLQRFADEAGDWRPRARRALFGEERPVAPWEEALVGGWTTAGYTDAAGERLVDRFPRERGRELTPDEAAALGCLRDASWYSLFEVREVRLREGLQLDDLLFERSLFVVERLGTLSVDPGDLLVGWVVRLDDHHELSGACAAVPPLHREPVLAVLRAELAAGRSAQPGVSDERIVRAAIPVVHRLLHARAEAWVDCSREVLGVEVGPVPELLPAPSDVPTTPNEEPSGGALVLRAAPAGSHGLPPLPHEVMAALVPGLRQLVSSLARRMRASPSWGPSSAWSNEDLAADVETRDFLEAFAAACHAGRGWSRTTSLDEANILGHHVFYMANFEAHYRKTFWVDESLAFQLHETDLDVEGEFLKPPFPACAFVFTDAPTLRLVASALAQDPDRRRRALRAATVHLTRIPAPENASGLDVSLLVDHADGDWPYLLARHLLVHPRDRLDAVLESTFPDVRERSPVFSSRELKEVVHLVLNAALYATTAHLDAAVLGPPADPASAPRGPGRPSPATPTRAYSAEDVFYLPGKIPISRVRQLRALGGGAEGFRIFKRFMVRGHWRRPASSWKDQHLRWIEPYWKGPDDALILEREYKMKP